MQEKNNYEYLVIMDLPPADYGYWPKGIENPCKSNPQMQKAAEEKWNGDINKLIREKRKFIREIIDAKIPLIVVPFPDPQWIYRQDGRATWDIEYARDAFVCKDREDKALLLNMGEESRKNEWKYWKTVLNALGVDSVKAERRFGQNEGGNTRRFIVDGEEWIVTAASGRTDRTALIEEVCFLDIQDSTRWLDLEIKQDIQGMDTALHLDCVYTQIVGEDNQVIVYVHEEAFTTKSLQRLERFVEKDLPGTDCYFLSRRDAKNLAANFVQAGLHIFASKPFENPDTENSWRAVPGIEKKHMTPLTQNLYTGGQTHCLTNEIRLATPVDPKQVNEIIRRSSILTSGAQIEAHNNYT